MTKLTKILISASVGAVVVAGSAIGGAFAATHHKTEVSTNSKNPSKPRPQRPGSDLNTGNLGNSIISPFSFSTYQLRQETVNAKPLAIRENPTRITKEFQSGWIQVGANSEDAVYQSADYYNQRDFMPILNDTWRMRNYANERNVADVRYGKYNGWTGGWLDETTTRHFTLTGDPVRWDDIHNQPLTLTTYKATQGLKDYLAKNNQQLPQDTIRMVMLDCTFFKNDDEAVQINKYLEYIAKNEIPFITIKAPSQKQIERIKIPEGTKKLTIFDYDTNQEIKWNKSQLESLRGIQIPSSVQELEFYSGTCTKIDPLILSSNTHMIYDHIHDTKDYYLAQANFQTIDLSKHAKLSDQDLQKAIDTVYGERQYERSFQGNFSKGYISNLDLTNTGVTTLNNVAIPSQSDGRFNIAYVKWTSNNNSGQSSIVITDPNKPSNDAQVGEWYDPSNNVSNITKLEVRTTHGVSLEQARDEIVGQLKKFPNVTQVDIKGVYLLTGSYQELEQQIKDAFKSEDGNVIREIQFITK